MPPKPMTPANLPTRRDSLRYMLLAAAGAASTLTLPGLLHAAPPPPFTSRRIVVRAEGAGPDVILIPGLGGGPGTWSRLVRDLPGWRWHLVHVRGFAGLPAGANATGELLTPLADEIGRYIQEQKLGAPAVIGHSMGGTLAMLAALRAPARVGRLMVVDMLPAAAGMIGGTAEGMGFLARQLRSYFTGTVAGRRAFAQLLQDATPSGRDSDPDVIADALDELAALDLGPRLAAIRAPLTVVPALPADAQTAAALLSRTRTAWRPAPGARIVPVQPSGHMVMIDQPAKFAATVRHFLRHP
ncbi:alpha/beta hydrolase [Sphingobium sufflavum]|uniref:alpha/beta fold hydrolase n=1 Tax=Sphingobium sufflavum TaxID=1129547 RepID=UPI001F3100E2|nr:alpha/beta hydrolase [Sphingobium sufflavum]MCE7795228.1 alpha/beta hydrolase [Sphingobium sufflavum]